jgi:two-component system, NtrC family, response regulator AtoC
MAKGETPTQTPVARTVLIVDDHAAVRLGLAQLLQDSGLATLEAANGDDAMTLLRDHPVDAVVLDLKLGGEDGLDVLAKMLREDPVLPVLMLTAHGTIDHAVQAVKRGAYGFLQKVPNYEAQLEVELQRALEHKRLRLEVEMLRAGDRGAQALIGESPGLKRALTRLEKAGRSSSATVLIHGETGSGKGLLARYLHAHSARAGGPFVELNCSAIPEQLLESELYGHEKGAFTDAKRFKKGLFELADGGTLFLDEIGEMTPGLQAKLLHVLEHRTFRRVGGSSDITVDVRVIAATHRDLKRAVEESRFREDLYFRLNVVPIEVPPLRERPEDIPVLAEHFVGHFCRELGRPALALHPAALRSLLDYAWPGNVRELKNVIERVVLLEAEDEIRAEHLPSELARGRAPAAAGRSSTPFPPGVVRPMNEVEQLAIEHALQVCEGNKTRAAQLLGISRQTLRTKLKEFRIEDEAEDAAE